MEQFFAYLSKGGWVSPNFSEYAPLPPVSSNMFLVVFHSTHKNGVIEQKPLLRKKLVFTVNCHSEGLHDKNQSF